MARDAYKKGRLWCIPPKVREELRRLPDSVLNTYLGADGYGDLKNLLGIIERARSDQVLIRQSER